MCWSTLRTKKILSSPQILNEGGGRYCKALPCQLRTKSDFSDQYTYLILYCNKHKALQRSTDISSTRSKRNGSLCLLIKISEARDKALVLKWPKFVYSLITEAIITPKVHFAYKDPWLIDFRTIKLGSRNGVTPVWRVQYNHNTVQTVVMPLCLASLKRPRWDLMGLWLCIELRWGCLLLHCCTGYLWQQSALQRCVYQPGAVHSTLGHYSKLQP